MVVPLSENIEWFALHQELAAARKAGVPQDSIGPIQEGFDRVTDGSITDDRSGRLRSLRMKLAAAAASLHDARDRGGSKE